MDRAFLTATAVPLMGLAGAILYKFRPLDWQKQEGKQVSWKCSTKSDYTMDAWVLQSRLPLSDKVLLVACAVRCLYSDVLI